jgi:hypothetical protein
MSAKGTLKQMIPLKQSLPPSPTRRSKRLCEH